MKLLNTLSRFLPGGARQSRRPQGQQQTSVPPAPQIQEGSKDPGDAEASPAQAGLPQLGIVSDPELMREVLQRHLRPLEEETYEILECQIPYLHHREGFRCVVHYDLRLAEPDTGRERSQLVTGLIYTGDKTRRTWNELQHSEPRRGLAGAVFEPYSYVPDLGMLLQVFPHDHRLPGLPLLMAGPSSDLETLLLSRFGPGEWQAEAWDVEPLRYRADQRAALRLEARARDSASGQLEERRFYAKIYNTEERGEQAYQVLRELWDNTEDGAGFTVGEPITYLGGLRTLVQAEVPGTSLEHILRREREVTPAVRRAARALAALHTADVVAPRRHLLQDEAAKLERAGESLRSAYPHLGPRIEKLVGNIVAGLEEVPPAPSHGDLKPLHILLDGDSVAFIDLDNFVGADPILDTANLLRNLAQAKARSRLSEDRSRGAAIAFAGEYFAHVPEDWRARLPLHYAGNILKKATQSLRRPAAGQHDVVEARLREAEDSLAGKIW